MGKRSSRQQKPSTAPEPWGTPARMRHTVQEDARYRDPESGKNKNPNGVKVHRFQPLIERYRDRGLITERQFKSAGDLYKASQAEPKDGEGVKVDCATDPELAKIAQIDRRNAYRAMRDAVDADKWPMVEWVVIEDKALSTGSRQSAGRATTLAMGILRAGLDQLSVHLGR